VQSYDALLQLCCRMGRHAVEALNRTVLTFQQCTRECREAPEPAWGSSTGSLWHVMGALWYLSVWVRCRGLVSSAACAVSVQGNGCMVMAKLATNETLRAHLARKGGVRAVINAMTLQVDRTKPLTARYSPPRCMPSVSWWFLDGGRAHALHGKPRSRNARPRPSRECHAGARARRYVANRTRC
jgi:hypothetical protein